MVVVLGILFNIIPGIAIIIYLKNKHIYCSRLEHVTPVQTFNGGFIVHQREERLVRMASYFDYLP